MSFIFYVFFHLAIWSQETDPTMTIADQLYDQGDCNKAIPEYKKLIQPKMSQELREKLIMRISYCNYTLGKFSESEKGFALYLKLFSHQDEVRIKYAESLYYQQKYKQAEKALDEIKNPALQIEAKTLKARI